VGLAFNLWDDAFSAIHLTNPTVEHCIETQEQIDKAMVNIRSMGYCINNTKNAWNGKSCGDTDENYTGQDWNLMEHWIEQYHQTGFRLDMAYCCVGSLSGQAAIQSSTKKRAHNPRVQLNKQLFKKRIVGIRKKMIAVIKSKEKKIQIKHERREHAPAEILTTIELERKEAIKVKLKFKEDMEDHDELI
jgi:hypothetical protein